MSVTSSETAATLIPSITGIAPNLSSITSTVTTTASPVRLTYSLTSAEKVSTI